MNVVPSSRVEHSIQVNWNNTIEALSQVSSVKSFGIALLWKCLYSFLENNFGFDSKPKLF